MQQQKNDMKFKVFVASIFSRPHLAKYGVQEEARGFLQKGDNLIFTRNTRTARHRYFGKNKLDRMKSKILILQKNVN